MRNLKLRKGVLLFIFIFLVLGGIDQVFAALMNFDLRVPENAMKDNSEVVIPAGSGFVQFIKGNPDNPPKGVASDANGQFSGTDAYINGIQPPFAGLAIKGAVGYGLNWDGGFFVSNIMELNLNDSFYVRYWTPDSAYYGNSTMISPWTAGEPVPAEMNYTIFALYKAAAPYSITVNTVIQRWGNEKQVYAPLAANTTSDLTFNFTAGTTDPTGAEKPVQIAGSAAHAQKYQLRIKKDTNFNDENDLGGKQHDTDGTSYTVNTKDDAYFVVGATYYARVIAYNHFGVTAGNVVQFTYEDLVGAGPGAISITYNFAAAGIRQFAISVDPTKADFQLTVGGVASTPNNIDTFLKALNSNQINTFGWWDGTKPVGYIITWTGVAAPYTPTYTAVNGAPANGSGALVMDRVYQMAISAPLTFTISGTR